MKYMLLLYGNEANDTDTTPEQMQEMLASYGAFNQAMAEAGVHRGGEGLHPTAAATTVTVSSGNTLTTHGPFAETKEHLGGYYLIEVDNLDDAIAWAAQCPMAAMGGKVEIRPIMEYDL